jgi:hypothetical protein
MKREEYQLIAMDDQGHGFEESNEISKYGSSVE